jgi:hypothetical protein
MPIPLPAHADTLRRVYEDSSAIAAAMQRLIDQHRKFVELYQAGSAEFADAERKLNEMVDSNAAMGPAEARIRIQSYLDVPTGYRDGTDAVLAWWISELSSLASSGFDARFDMDKLLLFIQRKFLTLRDAALTKLSEITADPPGRRVRPPAGTEPTDGTPTDGSTKSSAPTQADDRYLPADGRHEKRIPREEAICRLMEGIKAFERKGWWGKTKKDLVHSVNVPWSSAMRYFEEEQGLQNRWSDYGRKSVNPR